MNDMTSVKLMGVGYSLMASIFSGSIVIPSTEIATSTTPSTLVFPFYDVLDIGATPGAKSMSLFGGNPGISPKTSLKSLKTRWSKLLSILSLVASSIWDTKNWHSFLKLFFSFMDEISQTTTTLGMP
jgi:hypothetical protein